MKSRALEKAVIPRSFEARKSCNIREIRILEGSSTLKFWRRSDCPPLFFPLAIVCILQMGLKRLGLMAKMRVWKERDYSHKSQTQRNDSCWIEWVGEFSLRVRLVQVRKVNCFKMEKLRETESSWVNVKYLKCLV